VPSVGWIVFVTGFLEFLVDPSPRQNRLLRGLLQAANLAAPFVFVAPWQESSITVQHEVTHNAQNVFGRYNRQIRALIGTPRRAAKTMLPGAAAGITIGTRSSRSECVMTTNQSSSIAEAPLMSVTCRSNRSKYDYVLDWENERFVRPSAKYNWKSIRRPPGQQLSRLRAGRCPHLSRRH